ncbi:MAG: TrkA family potassium uptake protein [Desulfovibrionaceae bacterium]
MNAFTKLRVGYTKMEQRYGSLGPFTFSLVTLVLLVYLSIFAYMTMEGWTFSESLYQVIITLSTVGFQEVHTMSDGARTYTIFLIIVGVGNFMFMVACMSQFLVESNLHKILGRRKVQKSIDKLEGHYIICGYGRIGAVVVEELTAEGHAVVVIENDQEANVDLASSGTLHISGDATSDEILMAAGLPRAKALIAALSQDSANVYVVLAARQVNPNMYIVARAGSKASIPRLERAGANRVVMPYMIGGLRMAQSVLRPTVTSFMELAQRGKVDLSLEEFRISPNSELVGKTLASSQLRARFNAIVITIKKSDGDMVFNPPHDYEIQVYDTLLIVGQGDNLKSLNDLVKGKSGTAQ